MNSKITLEIRLKNTPEITLKNTGNYTASEKFVYITLRVFSVEYFLAGELELDNKIFIQLFSLFN